MTHQTLNLELERIEAERNALFHQLQNHDDKELNKKPSPDAWSVIEVLHHLITAEAGSVQYLRKKTQDLNGAQQSGIKEIFRSLLINTFLALPFKIKAPAVASPNISYATLADTRAKWDQVRLDVRKIINDLPGDALDKNWFKHPLAGKISLHQMINFFGNHLERHQHQIWRTIKEVRR